MNDHVLIVTGGLLTSAEKSKLRAIRLWLSQFAHADAMWLDFKVKLVMAEPLLGMMLEQALLPFRPQTMRDAVKAVRGRHQAETPSLTEVLLMTLLHERNAPFETTTFEAVFADPAATDRLLDKCGCIFLSSTYLHDLSEIQPILRRLKRPHNRIVLGGALAGVIHDRWEGLPEIDVVAVGYGELLADSLVHWIRSGFRELVPPPTGRLAPKTHSTFLYSGVPATRNLDFLSRPDWKLAADYHGRRFDMIYYESVRGCPYRCSFCNYPFLFDDHRFRYRSAEQMALDWEHYVSTLGVEYITCLDSLFTMPRQRLRAFCSLLIERGVDVKWICYARADDLADEETVALMKRAGAHQVQIGIESGDPRLLENMNKASGLEANRRALRNCRKHGLTSVVSLIVGYPGEDEASIRRTYAFLAENPPDFYFLAAFSTRIAGVPVLQPDMRRRFGLETMDNLYSMAPYWRHDTMSCGEAGNHLRWLDKELMRNRVSLNAVLFYGGMLAYRPQLRQPLLDFQQRVVQSRGLERIFDRANDWVDVRMDRDVELHLRPASAAGAGE